MNMFIYSEAPWLGWRVEPQAEGAACTSTWRASKKEMPEDGGCGIHVLRPHVLQDITGKVEGDREKMGIRAGEV